MRAGARLAAGEGRPWLALLLAGRLLATAIAVLLLAIGTQDVVLLALTGYGVLSTAVLALSADLRQRPWAWALDCAIVLALVIASQDWRSPFYLLWLTTLALPATTATLRQAAWLGLAAAATYLLVALLGGPAPGYLRPLTSETLVIHLVLPAMLVFGLAYAADVLRRLQVERSRRERLAVEAERRRIAWELHDSAKQRLHAAHLMVSSLRTSVPEPLAATVQRASVELESASADMDASLAELRSPLEGRPLHVALRARVEELATADGPRIEVRGRAPRLPPLVAAHVYRIGCEALTNALRHAEAHTIDVTLETDDGRFRLGVRDDGRGLPDVRRPQAMGMQAMQSRAASIGAQLVVAPGEDGRGTRVAVELPLADPRTPEGAT